MIDFSQLQNPVRTTLLGLLSMAAGLMFIGIFPVSDGTATGTVLLLAIVLTDLLHDLSPDTPDPSDELQPLDGLEPDLDTDLLLVDAWRGDSPNDD